MNTRASKAGRRPSQRAKDVDHQRPVADLAVVWESLMRSRSAGSCRARHEGFFHAQDRRQAQPAHLDDRRDRAPRRARARANLLPNVHGLTGPLGCLTKARYGIGWGAMGAAGRLRARARRYAIDRTSSDDRWPRFSSRRKNSSTCTTKSAGAPARSDSVGSSDEGRAPRGDQLLKRNNCAWRARSRGPARDARRQRHHRTNLA